MLDLEGWSEVRGITVWQQTLRDAIPTQTTHKLGAATQVGAPRSPLLRPWSSSKGER
jgi:hypothetical protein